MTSLEMLIAGSFVNLLQVVGCPVRRCSTEATLERCRTGRGFTAIAGGAGQGVVWARGRQFTKNRQQGTGFARLKWSHGSTTAIPVLGQAKQEKT